MKFNEGKIGMRVVIKNSGSSYIKGTKGTIVEFHGNNFFGVRIDDETFSHVFYPDWFDISDELPIPFMIKGEKHHLLAFIEDLKILGYKGEYINNTLLFDNNKALRLNGDSFKHHDFEAWIKLYYSSDLNYNWESKILHKDFNLPNQWNEALECAKQFIGHSYWTQEKKKEEILYIKYGNKFTFPILISDEITYFDRSNPVKINILDLKNFYYRLSNISNLSIFTTKVEYVTIGCKPNVPVTEIKRIIETYEKLNS